MKQRDIKYYKSNVDDIQQQQFFKKLKNNDLEKELEVEFSNYASAKHLLALNNFTSALHLSMCAINLKRGDKVICSVNSSPELPEVVRHFDAEPVFVDIEKDSFKIDLNHLQQVVDGIPSKKLKAVLVSHVAGELLNLEKIKNIVKDRNLLIIEDATNSIGLDRDKCDEISDIKIFSFDNENSHLGLFATNNEEIYNRAKLLSNHGLTYEEDSQLNYIYDVVDIGCQYEVSKINLLYSIDLLEQVSANLKIRKDIAKKYIISLSNVPHIKIQEFRLKHSYSQFIIKVDKNRDGFAKDLQNIGIETKLHYIPLHLLNYYKLKYNLKINSFPNALRNYQQILSIPIHSKLTDLDVAYIIDNIKILAKNRV